MASPILPKKLFKITAEITVERQWEIGLKVNIIEHGVEYGTQHRLSTHALLRGGENLIGMVLEQVGHNLSEARDQLLGNGRFSGRLALRTISVPGSFVGLDDSPVGQTEEEAKRLDGIAEPGEQR